VKRPQDPTRCPLCGRRALTLVTDGLVGRDVVPPFFTVGQSRIETRMVPAPFIACMACDYCEEVR
jgi:hypothetical protein